MIFTQETKMVEVALANHLNLHIIHRFGIAFGFGDKTINEVCQASNLDTQIFLLVINSLNDKSETEHIQLNKNQLLQLLAFLKNTHQYYYDYYLPIMRTTIENLMRACSSQTTKALYRFYNDYEAEVLHHLEHEEKHFFTYIEQFCTNDAFVESMIIDEEDHHCSIDEKIFDIKNLLIKYINTPEADMLKIKLLDQLFHFQEDQNRHAKIEDVIMWSLKNQNKTL